MSPSFCSPQLGFLAALGCEVFTGKPVLAQLAGNGSTILTWVLLVTAGTAVPILRASASVVTACHCPPPRRCASPAAQRNRASTAAWLLLPAAAPALLP